MRQSTSICVIILSSALCSCAALKSPQRPGYTGTDTVNSVQTHQLVGTWSVSDLNPYPNSEPQDTTIEYRADGTVVGTVVSRGESDDTLGNLTFELTGEWTLNGDTVVHRNITMRSTDNSPMGDLLSQMINEQNGISGQANIYELSTERMVMLGSDGAAMEYIRQ